MTSIRTFLIAGIVATLTLFNFVAALRGYQSSMQEAETLFDNQLLDLSQLVANLEIQSVNNDFRLGNNLAFQIWDGDELLAASYHAPAENIGTEQPGFEYANFGGYRWRTYTRFNEVRGQKVIVAERTDLRYVLAENVVLDSLAPILLGIPVVALLIWFIVGRGLKPLQQLSADLGQKKMQDLQPLEYDRSPHELEQVVQSINGFIYRQSETLEREKRFSADAAHELRTPISALKIQLHNLALEVNTDSDAWHALQQGVDRMQHLIAQLLSLYRSSPEQFAVDCSQLDLLEVTQDAVASFYPMIEERKQILELDGESCLITGERFALETLITNLLSNASKYTPEGGSINIQVAHKDNKVRLLVEDNGTGIPVADREQVFNRFYRSDVSNHAGVIGCGLGLAIVQHVALLHHAELSIDNSSFATGVAFRIDFPEQVQ